MVERRRSSAELEMDVSAQNPTAPATRAEPAIGSHVAVGGGLVRVGLAEAEQVEAEAIQIFAGNPRAWKQPEVDPQVDAAFRDKCGALELPVFVHASHLINLGSPSADTLESSVALLAHTMRRAADLGADAVVVHAGTSVDRGRRDAALAPLHGLIGRLLDAAAGQGVRGQGARLLIEPTAGGGEALASSVESTLEYLAAVNDDRVGVCLDTCHLHAAGEQITSAADMRRTVGRVVDGIGAQRIGLIHVNDSRDASGSRRDRHESLGSGEIGAAAYAGLFGDAALSNVPMVVETPSHREDVAFLKSQRSAAAIPRPPRRS